MGKKIIVMLGLDWAVRLQDNGYRSSLKQNETLSDLI
jgi:hypothetical protein